MGVSILCLVAAAVVVVVGLFGRSDGREMVRAYEGPTPWLDHPHPYHMLTPVSLGANPSSSSSRAKRQAIVMDQPIRITTVFADDVNTILQAAKSELVRNQILPKLLNFLQDSLSVAPTSGPILINNECTDGFFLRDPDTGNIMCASQCAPVTSCGTFQVPREHLKACSQCNAPNPSSVNTRLCQPGTPAQDGPGVTNTDFLLYVTADQSACPASSASAQTVAFALACQMEVTQDRPIAGVINFCPDGLQNRDADFAFALIKHEILHALAFSQSLFPFWRDPTNNEPRTQRSGVGLPQPDISATIDRITYTDWQTASGPMDHAVDRLVTPAVVAEARAHFNCSSLAGVPLENQGGTGTMLNHWEKRVFGNEGMTGQLTFNPVFSRITFAVLEDSGWYRVNYSLAEELIWGRGSGCRFVEGSCGEWMITQRNNDRSLSPFCETLENGDPLALGCSVDREAVTRCNRITNQPPPEYQYFPGALGDGGRATIADYCPFQDVFLFSTGGGGTRGTVCSDENNLPGNNFVQEVYGQGSRCINHGRQWTINSVGVNLFGGGCYQYGCSEEGVLIRIATQEIMCSCSQAGTEMSVDVTVSGIRYLGSILCPPCIEICHDTEKSVISDGPLPTSPTTNGAPLSPASVLLTLVVASSLTSVMHRGM